jgi:predicted negative regulator of RcsB-dependent stress response
MYLPMSHLRRGDIYLQMGDRARAVEHYAKFVTLSKDCEPELVPLRNAAEKKIAALRKRLS